MQHAKQHRPTEDGKKPKVQSGPKFFLPRKSLNTTGLEAVARPTINGKMAVFTGSGKLLVKPKDNIEPNFQNVPKSTSNPGEFSNPDTEMEQSGEFGAAISQPSAVSDQGIKEIEPGAVQSVDEEALLELIDDPKKNVNTNVGSYWRSVSDDIGGYSRTPFGTEVKYTNEIREQSTDRFKKNPKEEDALFYSLIKNQPKFETGQESTQRIITSLDLTDSNGQAYGAWYELSYTFLPDGQLGLRTYTFLFESRPNTESDVQSDEEILKYAREHAVAKSMDVRKKVVNGSRYGKSFPVSETVKDSERQRTYFEGEGNAHAEVLSRFVETQYLLYKEEYRRVLSENRAKNKDEPAVATQKKNNRDAIKKKVYNRVVNSSGTYFLVELSFKEFTGSQDEMSNQVVAVEEINVMYMGKGSSVTKTALADDFGDKSAIDYKMERFRESMGAIDVEFEGFESLPDPIRKQEQYFLIRKAGKMISAGRTNTEIDLTVPVNYAPEGETSVYELVYYTFISVKNPDNSVTVNIKRIGKANAENSKYGDAEVLRLRDVFGFREDATKDELLAFLSERYPSMKGMLESADTKEEVFAIAEKELLESSGTPEWFKTNYKIRIWNASSDGAEAIDFLKKKHQYDLRSSNRTVHPDIRNNNRSETDGLIDWSAADLRYLEMSLQKLSPGLLKHLDGVNYMRQEECLLMEHYKLPSGITHSGAVYTVILYDKAFSSEPGHLEKKEYSFRGNEDEVSSAHTGTPTHETGHVIQNLGPSGDTNGDRFVYFYTKIVNGPEHGFESEGITGYARGELNPESTPDTIKKREYFPEAFDLFMHDPEGLYRARPKIYMWFAYMQLKGSAPSAATSKVFVKKWMDFKKENGHAPDRMTSLTFIS